MRKALFTLGAAVLLAFIYWYWFYKPSFVAIGSKLIGCAVNGDAGCIEPYIPENEKSLLNLNEAKLQAFLTNYYSPNFQEGKLGPPFVESAGAGSGSVMVGRNFVAGTKSIELTCEVTQADEGIRAAGFITSLVLTVGNLKFGGPREAHGIDKLRIWARQAEQDGPELTKLGMPGIYRNQREGLATWSAWAASCKERAAKAQAALSGGTAGHGSPPGAHSNA